MDEKLTNDSATATLDKPAADPKVDAAAAQKKATEDAEWKAFQQVTGATKSAKPDPQSAPKPEETKAEGDTTAETPAGTETPAGEQAAKKEPEKSEEKSHGEKIADGIAVAKKAEEERSLRRVGIDQDVIDTLSDEQRGKMVAQIGAHLTKQDERWKSTKDQLAALQKQRGQDSPETPTKADKGKVAVAATHAAVSDPSDPDSPEPEDGVIGLIDEGFDPKAASQIKAAFVSRDKELAKVREGLATEALKFHALLCKHTERDLESKWPGLKDQGLRQAVYKEMDSLDPDGTCQGNPERLSTLMTSACKIILGRAQDEAARGASAAQNREQRNGQPDPAKHSKSQASAAVKLDPEEAAFRAVSTAHAKGRPETAGEELTRLQTG